MHDEPASKSILAILEERAQQLAVPPLEERLASEFVEVVVFRIGGERFGLGTSFVSEVLRPEQPTWWPGRGDALVGFVNLRGEVLPLMDAGSILGSGRVERAEWVLAVGRDRAEFGLVVEAVEEVVELRNETLFQPASASRVAATGLVSGISPDGLVLLDGHEVLGDDRFRVEDREA